MLVEGARLGQAERDATYNNNAAVALAAANT
jgi:hypothetical protein